MIGALNFLFGFNQTSKKLANNPELASAGFGMGFVVTIFIISIMLNILIWYFISVRASKIAKWILIVFFVIGLLSIIRNFNSPFAPQGLAFGVMMVLTVLQGAGVYMLFRSDAIGWFNGKRPVDPEIFR